MNAHSVALVLAEHAEEWSRVIGVKQQVSSLFYSISKTMTDTNSSADTMASATNNNEVHEEAVDRIMAMRKVETAYSLQSFLHQQQKGQEE